VFSRYRQFLAVVPAALLLGALLVPGSALAHERRTIGGGKYDVTVGWDVEPAYQNLKNAASIRIVQAGTDTPIGGADKTLKVQIRQGAATKDFPLRAVFGRNGYYVADLVPTREGDYVWTFTGTIGSDQVNEKFDSADGKFDKVDPQTALQFPVALPDTAQNATALQAAQAEVQSTRTLAYVGIGIGVLGLLAGAGAWLARPRPPKQRPAGQPAGERI
jgi:hypothetical protein